MLIGAHVSVAGGYARGLEYAESVGAECMQIFAKSPRQWRGPAHDPAEAAAFVEARKDSGFGPVFTHTAYLLNLSTIDPVLLEKTVVALADELVRAGMIAADGVVTHVGNDPERDDSAAAKRAAATILAAYEIAGEAANKVRLLLENTAGGGSAFGCTFEQLDAVCRATGFDHERIGVCLDTCHAFAFGMALETHDGWANLVRDIENTVGLERLALIHANDCMFERGSRRDRHAWIGDGLIGSAGFEAMMCMPELEGVAVVTEMPGEKPVKDEINLGRLKHMRDSCA